jgi:hypothetical protein
MRNSSTRSVAGVVVTAREVADVRAGSTQEGVDQPPE